MVAVTSRPLTERQQAVMERIDRRVPIKVVAHELGVSETRVNQHIRALKDIFEVDSLNDLVEAYRASKAPLNKAAYTNPELGQAGNLGAEQPWADTEEYLFADAGQFPLDQQWRTEPRIVPGMLDGSHAVLLRLAMMIGMALAVTIGLILLVSVALGLSGMLDGVAAIPETQ